MALRLSESNRGTVANQLPPNVHAEISRSLNRVRAALEAVEREHKKVKGLNGSIQSARMQLGFEVYTTLSKTVPVARDVGNILFKKHGVDIRKFDTEEPVFNACLRLIDQTSGLIMLSQLKWPDRMNFDSYINMFKR